jgi:hypothetical protein
MYRNREKMSGPTHGLTYWRRRRGSKLRSVRGGNRWYALVRYTRNAGNKEFDDSPHKHRVSLGSYYGCFYSKCSMPSFAYGESSQGVNLG